MRRRDFLTLSAHGMVSASASSLWSLPPLFARGEAFTASSAGILQTASDLHDMRSAILQGKEPWVSAWHHLREEPTSDLSFTPKPTAHVFRGSYGAGGQGVNELQASVDAAHSHALQWVVTRDERHALKSAEILDAWSGLLEDFSGNDAKLLAGWTTGFLCEALEILRMTWPGLPPACITRFARLLREVVVPLIAPFFPEANGNWDAAMMFSLIAIGALLRNDRIITHVVRHFRFGPGNGGLTRYVYPSGECEESTRDQSHTQLGLGYFALTAAVAWNQGLDLFSEADYRLALGFEYTSRYMLGEEVFCSGAISGTGRGRIDDFYQAAVAHYVSRLGFHLPFTERAAELARKTPRNILSLHRKPLRAAARELPRPWDSGGHPGASIEEMAGPSNAIAVAPGEPLQQRIDEATQKGHPVFLLPGLHQMDQPLVLRSDLTLLGSGRSSVLMLTPAAEGYCIANPEQSLHNVTLSNFLLNAAPFVKSTRDPNQDRRPLHSQLAPLRGGISLVAPTLHRMTGLTLDRISIRNATGSGLLIENADDLQLSRCDFAFNGGAVAPGEGLHHNAKIIRCTRVSILSTRLVDSFCGDGLNLQHADSITLQRCEIGRNARHAVRASDTSEMKITACLLEGNGGAGVLETSNGAFVRTRSLEGNVARNNAGNVDPLL